MKAKDLKEVIIFRLDDLIKSVAKANQLIKQDKPIDYQVRCITKSAEMIEYDYDEYLRRKKNE